MEEHLEEGVPEEVEMLEQVADPEGGCVCTEAAHLEEGAASSETLAYNIPDKDIRESQGSSFGSENP